MTKKKDTSHQRLLSAARKALAARHAEKAVPAFNARTARIDSARKRAREENEPTPEQEAKAVYVETDVNEYVGSRRMRIGRAFRRQPRFETIEGLTVPQLMALRRYRKAFDTSEISPVKSGLDIGTGGGTGGAEAALSRIEAVAFADFDLRRIEMGISPHHLANLRPIALLDHDMTEVALARFGSASGQRRAQVRSAFLAAVDALVAANQPKPRQAVPQQPAPAPCPAPPATIHPAFLDERGFMRPLDEIAELIRDNVAKEQAGPV